jgi:hypothetical protein
MGKGPVNRAQKRRVIFPWHLGAIDRSNWISKEGRNNLGQLTSEKTESCKQISLTKSDEEVEY